MRWDRVQRRSSCAEVGLGAGALRCSGTCTLDTSSCAVRDYCTANNLYGNNQCDACELLGGVRDPDCDAVCGGDGMCADRFDSLTNSWTCRRLGKVDPDCGMCGNGVVDGNELCDQRAFANNQFTCADFGFLGGELTCKNDCSPNFTACMYSVCGDGTIEGPEACEAGDFRGDSCQARGQAGGMLTCTSSCTISQSSCVAPGCNNNIVEPDRGEDCDGTDIGPQSCTGLGFAGGALGCNGACAFDTTMCIAAGCGNNVIESPQEQCEGAVLGGATCMSLGFLQGTLTCSPTSCTYDTSACVAPGCGNMIIEAPAEQCDGTNLNGASCESLGFATGSVTCDGSCRYNTSACVAAGCGNMIIEPSEQCEGTNLNGATCISIGWEAGDLACDANCHFDQNSCFGNRSFCGNGRRDALEGCDGGNFGMLSTNCADYGLGSGTVTCHAATCRLLFDGCMATDMCAQGGWYGDGVCDLCEYYSASSMRDPDCGDAISPDACGLNGVCAEYFDPLVGAFSCELIQGARDPDCNCGNGSVDPPINMLTVEFCDGSAFAANVPRTCSSFGFTSGMITCGNNCAPNFEQCF